MKAPARAPSLRGAKRRSNPSIHARDRWIASLRSQRRGEERTQRRDLFARRHEKPSLATSPGAV
ncbi:hypothetical protein XH93_35130 [Bradyrhizobium sp. CCBAU 51753]|nr:hypothetical protein XH93_35130 [Bradyrhizobium sp. CCBAU 51753]